MHNLIDIYVKQNGRWIWADSTRMCKTLADAQRRFGGDGVQARWA